MSGNTTIKTSTTVTTAISLAAGETLDVLAAVTVENDNTSQSRQSALYGPLGASGVSIVNHGTVSAIGSSSVAIRLEDGGAVSNASGGAIYGAAGGVYLSGGTVLNAGSIGASASASEATGIQFGAQGGSIDNLGGGVISGTYFAAIAGGSGTVTVTNAGTITGSNLGVAIGSSGSLDNQSTGVIVGGVYSGGAGITNSGNISGFVTMAGSGTVINSGSVSLGVGLAAQATIINSGSIGATGSYSDAIRLTSGDQVINSNLIVDTASGSSAISLLGAGDSVTNQSGGTVIGAVSGIYAQGSLAAISNAGLISSTGSAAVAVEFQSAGSVENLAIGKVEGGILFNSGAGTLANAGTIVDASARTAASAVYFKSGGIATNSGVISAIGAQVVGVGAYGFGGPATVVNSGTISATGANVFGISLPGGGSVTNSGTVIGGISGANAVTNSLGGVILGQFGIQATNGSANSVVNDGSIGASGSYLQAVSLYGGSMYNSGIITDTGSRSSGVVLTEASLTNAAGALISGFIGVEAVPAGAGGPAGTIVAAGTIDGTGGVAVDFSGGPGLLVIEPGAVFVGELASNSGGAIELASAASAGVLSAPINAIGTITEQAGARWTMEEAIKFGAVTIDQGASLTLAGAVASGATIAFAGTSSMLALDAPLKMAGTLAGFVGGDQVVLENQALSKGDQISITSAPFQPAVLDVVNSGGQTLAALVLGTTGPVTATDFTLAAAPGGGVAVISDVPCFVRGTRIRTARGEVAVEALAVGDEVVVDGGGRRPVVWIGRRAIDLGRHPRPQSVQPIRILAHAFAERVPARDLLVSPGHALFVDGALIPAEYLVNGATVRREPAERVEYFHVELDAHAVLFSENLPSESYLDRGNRSDFENGAAFSSLHPDFSAPRADALVLALDGPRLEAARRRLLARIPALGFVLDAEEPFHLTLDGRRLAPVRGENGWHSFLLRSGKRQVRLSSPAAAPAAFRGSKDWRPLGVQLRAVVLDDRAIDLGSPVLRAGFYPLERDAMGSWRWSDGDGELVLPASPRPAVLRLRLGEVLPRWRATDECWRAGTAARWV